MISIFLLHIGCSVADSLHYQINPHCLSCWSSSSYHGHHVSSTSVTFQCLGSRLPHRPKSKRSHYDNPVYFCSISEYFLFPPPSSSYFLCFFLSCSLPFTRDRNQSLRQAKPPKWVSIMAGCGMLKMTLLALPCPETALHKSLSSLSDCAKLQGSKMENVERILLQRWELNFTV